MSEQHDSIPVFPPPWFVENLNAGVSRDWAGDGPAPYRTALDPLVMAAWHMASMVPRTSLFIVTGC